MSKTKEINDVKRKERKNTLDEKRNIVRESK